MLSDVLGELVICEAVQEIPEAFTIVGGPQVGDRHRHELLTAIAVMRDGGFIDCEEAQAVPVENPHRRRIVLEQQAEGFFPASGLRDVLVCRYPAAIAHGLMDNRYITSVAKAIDGLIGQVDSDLVQPLPDVGLMVFRRVTAGNSVFENGLKRRARFRLFVGQPVDIGIFLVANDQALRCIEHADALRNIVERRVELLFLPLDFVFRLDLLGNILVGRDPAAVRHRLIDDLDDASRRSRHILLGQIPF